MKTFLIKTCSVALGLLLLCSSVFLLTGCGSKKEEKQPEGLRLATESENAAAVNQPQAGDAQADANTDAADVPAGEGSAEAVTKAPTTVVASSASHTTDEYRAAGVDELNSVPILMYHRIYDMTNDETDYTGGNVDADGYNRTSEAFEADLEMYYEMGYRMIRLTDFLDGKIDTEFGYSPLILTFDDGIRDVVVEGFEDDGTPIFDPSCAIAILEKIKNKYPDFNVTATFFVNCQMFENGEDDPAVMKWMVDNGYDIGNHTWDHAMLGECDADEIEYQVGALYKKLNDIIPGQYVNIVALPYGSPESMDEDEPQYNKIFSGTYEGFDYTSKGALLCAWTRSYSPFMSEFDITAIRRIRGYDNNGEEFDIQMNFEQLNAGTRYISDGDPNTIVIHAEDEKWLGDTFGLEVIKY